MAIPLTCPGCQAAFEVPDTLSGKTIRCTSCKTQLTVPAAGMVDAKKPFGWASSPANPAVPKVALTRPTAKAAVAAAVVEDDDEDDKKTSPNKASAKTGPKVTGAPKKRRDDDDDDDDDDDQPRRKKKKNASGGSGAMIALIAGGVICLAAVVGLSIWMLSGDKEKDAAKSDSKNTNSTPAPGGRQDGGGRPAGDGDANGDGGRRPGGSDDGSAGMAPNKPGRPGGGRPNSGGGAWQPFTVDGLSCEMPGTPIKQTQAVPGAGSVNLYLLADPSQKSGYMAMAISLPAEAAGQSGPILNAFAQGVEQNAGGLGGGFGHANVGVGTKTDITQDGFPGKDLQLVEKSTRQGMGSMRVVVAGNKMYVFGAFAEDYSAFQSQAAQFFASVKITGAAAGSGAVAAGGGGAGAGTDAGVSDTPPTGGGISPGGPPPGVGFPGRPPGGPMRPPGGAGFPGPGDGGIGSGQPPGGIPGRPPGGPMRPPGGAGFPGTGPGDGDGGIGIGQPQPPGGIPGQPPGGVGGGGAPGRPPGGPLRPPGGGGQPGRPPGGAGAAGAGGDGPTAGGGGFGQPTDPNPAPFGVNTNGKKKTTLAPNPQFFTGAFDSSKKEFFTFSSEGKGKVVTKLNRYNVAKNFDSLGSYKVPRFVTRAVIDPAKGLLYAATATANAAVGSMQYDQAAGVGDVDVYDLNAIRDGKVATGADLKPLGTFLVGSGKKIHGLELTPDGKTLIVLTTTTSTNAKNPPKSFLTQYDTETRKPIENVKPKPLAEPAWDMTKSRDGKFLIVVDLAVGQAGTANVRTFDIETLSADKSLPLLGMANDVALAPSGQFAGVVAGVAGSKLVLANAEETKDFDLGFGWKAAFKPGYVEYSADGKQLFVSGHVGMSGGRQAAGLDVYEVTDPNSPTGLKKKASIVTAGDQAVGGHFFLSPDGEYLVFHTGVVVATNDIGGSNGEAAAGTAGAGGAAAPGFPGGGAVPGPLTPGGGGVPGPVAPGAGGVPGPITPGVGGGTPAPGRPPGGPQQQPPGRPPAGGPPPGAPTGPPGGIPPQLTPGTGGGGAPAGLPPITPGTGGGAPQPPANPGGGPMQPPGKPGAPPPPISD